MKTVKMNILCPICRQALTLKTFEEDFVPPRQFRMTVSRIPYHPLPLIAAGDARLGRLGIHCLASNQVVYERCDGEHKSPECIDPTCWKVTTEQP